MKYLPFQIDRSLIIQKSGLLLIACVMFAHASFAPHFCQAEEAKRLTYRHPGLIVDLGVGLWSWPLPIDFDQDGDMDLVITCPDKPYGGTYFFENTEGKVRFPVFKPAVRIGAAHRNIQISHVKGTAWVLNPAVHWQSFEKRIFSSPRQIYPTPNIIPASAGRANQWKVHDFDDDGALDLVVGTGDWSEYGWDDAYNSQGEWTNGPLHGYVFLLRNQGTTDSPSYATPTKLTAGGKVIDVFGMPSPNFADFDGDGDADLICGEFLDGFTYFENVGSRQTPRFTSGRRLTTDGQEPADDGNNKIAMGLQMIVPVSVDWDGDGDTDLVVGDEDGRVALIENRGQVQNGMPLFAVPRYFEQQAKFVKFGALTTPVSFDFDGDGDEDLISGNTAGQIGWIENLDDGNPPRWARPRLLEVEGKPLRIQAGPNGSIQGPCEAKWGYTTLSVADWDGDTLPDLVVNSIWGKVVWYKNIGSRTQPRFASKQPVRVDWNGTPPKPAWTWWEPNRDELATQWRTTPVATDFNGDNLCDLIMLDHQGFLCLYLRKRESKGLVLQPPKRIFVDESGKPLQLNGGRAGKSGRRKMAWVDWDGDGLQDLLINGQNIDWYRNLGSTDGRITLTNMGPLADNQLAGHTTSPTTVDWDHNGIPDLLIGAEDGHFYYLPNPRAAEQKNK